METIIKMLREQIEQLREDNRRLREQLEEYKQPEKFYH